MTLSSEKNTKSHIANGSAVEFSYDFRVDDAEDMKVYLDGVLQVSGYTVNGLGEAAGGNVTFDVAPALDVYVTLLRQVGYVQETDYTPYSPFPAETHEAALDSIVMQTQQLKEITDRSIVAPPGSDPNVSYAMPLYEAGKGIMWDETNKELVNSDDDLNGMVAACAQSEFNCGQSETYCEARANGAYTARDAAQAAQAAAETAETNAETAETNAETAETGAAASAAAAATSETNAATSETNAAASAAAAATSETNAATSETNAAASAALAATYAVQKFTETYDPTTEGADGDLWFTYVA